MHREVIRREAILSSQITGTQFSLPDLLLFELAEVPGVPIDNVIEVPNYAAVLDHATARVRGGFPLAHRLLRELHTKLMTDVRDSRLSRVRYLDGHPSRKHVQQPQEASRPFPQRPIFAMTDRRFCLIVA